MALVVEEYVDHEGIFFFSLLVLYLSSVGIADTESLYRFAAALNFLSPKSVDIFPAQPHQVNPLIKLVCIEMTFLL